MASPLGKTKRGLYKFKYNGIKFTSMLSEPGILDFDHIVWFLDVKWKLNQPFLRFKSLDKYHGFDKDGMVYLFDNRRYIVAFPQDKNREYTELNVVKKYRLIGFYYQFDKTTSYFLIITVEDINNGKS